MVVVGGFFSRSDSMRVGIVPPLAMPIMVLGW